MARIVFICEHPDGCDSVVSEAEVIRREEMAHGIRLAGTVLCDKHILPWEMRRVEILTYKNPEA